MGKLTVSYEGDKIINTSEDGAFTLATKDKVLTDDVGIKFESNGFSIDSVVDRSFASGDLVIESEIIPVGIFANCKQLVSVSAPNLFVANDQATDPTYYSKVNYMAAWFAGCDSLLNVYLPKIKAVADYTFYNCQSLQSLHLESCNALYTSCLTNAKSLKTIVICGKESGYNMYPIGATSNLEAFDMSAPSKFYRANLFSAEKLNTIILRSDTVCQMTVSTALNGTAFASGKSGGTLYVPQLLVEQYEQATNWSVVLGYENNQILPIEGSEYENTYADDRPVVQEEST